VCNVIGLVSLQLLLWCGAMSVVQCDVVQCALVLRAVYSVV